MKLPGFLSKVKPVTFVTPVAATSEGGIVVGHNQEVWLWRVLESAPLKFGSDDARARHAARLHTMLADLGRTGRDAWIRGSSVGAEYREFHLIALNWTEWAQVPEGTPPRHAAWLDSVLRFSVGEGLFAVGVKLRKVAVGAGASLKPAKILRTYLEEAAGEPTDITQYAADRTTIASILGKAGGRVPTPGELRRLELWWKAGEHRRPDSLQAMPDGRSLAGDYWQYGNLEISAMAFYERTLMDAQGLWLADAFGHVESGCVAASIRGKLVPSKAVRDQMRRGQRKAKARVAEQEKTGDLPREEDAEAADLGQQLEEAFRTESEPLMRDVSLIMARETDAAATESYLDELDNRWGLVVKPVEYRQLSALTEMLPCGPRTIGLKKPFVQDCSIRIVAESGFGSMSRVGDDPPGIFVGLAPPDLPMVWLDPFGASKTHMPATMAVLGDSGSGKTFSLQSFATQGAEMDITTAYINPKPADSLDGFCSAAGGTTIKIATGGDTPGLLDPFRFAPEPAMAAEIASAHISTVLGDAITHQDRILMEAAFRRAADQDAQCVGDCLRHPDVPPEAMRLVLAQAEGSGLFALGIAPEPKPGLAAAGKGLTLIEFDRPLPIPPKVDVMSNYEPIVRTAIAVMRLVVRAVMEQMFAATGPGGLPQGGILIIDEAHVLMGSEEGLAIVERLGREGRSQKVLPILATQRVADVTEGGADLASYLSRVLCLKLSDRREAEAALKLLRLDPTEKRIADLANAGPSGDQPALAYHRDLRGRNSLVTIGPMPEHVRALYSTASQDREARAREAAA
ncbi:MAG: hypothetical protein F4Z31_02100 [Gemmatimonadetes bacterium]|nr:hypothetical protein [Gemmatimonadota bacterium]